jgi:hypothetical protein
MKTTLSMLAIAAILTACGGADGRNGKDGTNGAAGINGTNGADATPVTIVQLCPGTPSYGSVYVENAICLNGQLQAVYSANGGFLTRLTDGDYTSNGIGSACNFHVNGCTVTPN